MSSGIIIPGRKNDEEENELEDRDPIRYESCGFYIDTPETHEEALGRALVGATLRRRSHAEQQARVKGADAMMAKLAAESIEVKDPFAMEPAALSVFMMMVMEIKKLRDEINELKNKSSE